MIDRFYEAWTHAHILLVEFIGILNCTWEEKKNSVQAVMVDMLLSLVHITVMSECYVLPITGLFESILFSFFLEPHKIDFHHTYSKACCLFLLVLSANADDSCSLSPFDQLEILIVLCAHKIYRLEIVIG